MRLARARSAARWPSAIAPLLFVLAACDPEYGTEAPATSFGVVHAQSTPSAYRAEARFYSPFRAAGCEVSGVVEGCTVTRCESEPEPSPEVAATMVTLQAKETVVLDSGNEFQVEAERALFLAGDEVLFDLAPSAAVPGLRRTLTAPSSTALSTPTPPVELAALELMRGYALGLTWAPASAGYMRAYLSAGLVAVACEWPLGVGGALVPASLIAALPSSDGTDSEVAFWTEQSDVVRSDDWEFLLLLEGEVAGGTYQGFTLE